MTIEIIHCLQIWPVQIMFSCKNSQHTFVFLSAVTVNVTTVNFLCIVVDQELHHRNCVLENYSIVLCCVVLHGTIYIVQKLGLPRLLNLF